MEDLPAAENKQPFPSHKILNTSTNKAQLLPYATEMGIARVRWFRQPTISTL